jgi:hypothetical protein
MLNLSAVKHPVPFFWFRSQLVYTQETDKTVCPYPPESFEGYEVRPIPLFDTRMRIISLPPAFKVVLPCYRSDEPHCSISKFGSYPVDRQYTRDALISENYVYD